MTAGAAAGSRRRSSGVTPTNILTNGDFANSTGWNGPGTGGMTISGGKANYAATPAFNGLYRTIAPLDAQYYELTFTISSYSGGGVNGVMIFGSGGPVGTARTANGTYVERLLAGTGNTALQLRATAAGTTLSIDDVTLIGPYTTSTVGGP